MKIAYCIPALYYPSGMERVLTLKANYFAEVFTNCIRPSLFINLTLIMMN